MNWKRITDIEMTCIQNLKTTYMNRVLIALDYNPTAQKVAEVGFLMAKSMNAEVKLLHVISDPVYYSSTEYSPIMGFNGFMETGQIQLDNMDALKKAALHFLDKSRHHLGDKTIQTLVEEGDLAQSILKTAKRIHADIIVMGSHSRRWLENIVVGSVTEKVLHLTSIPLFIIPTKQKRR
jgi:nucleotide-binding universal stress UspA family protein